MNLGNKTLGTYLTILIKTLYYIYFFILCWDYWWNNNFLNETLKQHDDEWSIIFHYIFYLPEIFGAIKTYTSFKINLFSMKGKYDACT